jgi:transcription-repair coupling factor (superfamily II helicase)
MISLQKLVDQVGASSGEIIKVIKDHKSPIALGLRRPARLPMTTAIWRNLQRPLLLITDRLDRARLLAEELALWAPDAERFLFPEPTPLFYENAAWGENTRRDRLAVLTSLARYHIPGIQVPSSPPVIIAPARAIMTRTMPRRDFLKAALKLKSGKSYSMDALARTWIRLGYEATTTVIAPGQFARRGGLMDIWPPAEALPLRMEFFGDELDTFRRFNPATQLTIRSGESSGLADGILVTPAREFLVPSQAEPTPENETITPVDTPGNPAAFEKEAEPYSEFSLPLLHPFPASLLDYLPEQTLILMDDWNTVSEMISEIEEQAVNLRKELIQEGLLVENFPIPYLPLVEIVDSLSSFQSIELGIRLPEDGRYPADMIDQEPGSISEWFEAGPRFAGQIKPFIDHLHQILESGASVIILSRQASRLRELWAESQAALSPEDKAWLEKETRSGNRLGFIENSLAEGWVFSPPGMGPYHLITDGEIFGWRRPEPRQRHRPVIDSPEAPFSDLEPGDWVVHVDHGVGQFSGLVRRTVDNTEREFLCIEYADDAQLYVPVHQLDRLTRYVGPDSQPPRASHLGGQEWKNVKSHVKEAVQEVAEDLLELYARRRVVQGYAFDSDTTWQEELEASFPYYETEDQLRVIKEVKSDMESPRPMDRLICGDVGYGKTEVALRAAFKAVNDGKQVAMLVPTTVLAQQHYHTFLQRLAAFPVSVEMLSRFRTHQQQKEIVERVKNGAVDIVIGTHRLLSKDVVFKDLGLLIIDEEQRFGVTHKETLKRLRTEVDVLTMTATPIPRTLYMALSGVRDISTINTPPEERLPIITHVGPYSPKLIRQAILRELERGGQVFFVHNRVQTIGAMRQHLEKLVPEARMTIAHGQMAENDLSQRMEQFSKGEVDVLLSTSIIESGLDIPNANTLIVDRADTFGLAQLYQLRGRVGRGAQRAYSYFFRHNRKPPTLEGRQRLETIAENTYLGAGFNIAMRDLEIRGTGDILGTRQSGHIAAVGFHLYTRLLAEAVRKLRDEGGFSKQEILRPAYDNLMAHIPSVLVELPLAVNIPVDYVPDRSVRLGLYRRMANLDSLEGLERLLDEFKDRFGPPPEMVLNLVFQFQVKILAEKAGLASVGMESRQIVLRFPESILPDDLPTFKPEVRPGKVALWIPYHEKSDWKVILVDTLGKLVDYNQRIMEGYHGLSPQTRLESPGAM